MINKGGEQTMNLYQIETLEKVFTALNQSIEVHTFGETMVVSTPKKIPNPISFKSTSVLQMMCFLWDKAKCRTLVLSDDKRTHKITLMPYSENGIAKFAMQILLLPKDSSCFHSVAHVENLLPTKNSLSKTKQASYPIQASKIISCDWFNNLKKLLSEFNSKNIAI